MYIYSNVCFLLLNASRTCDFKNNTNKDNLILHVIEQLIFYILLYTWLCSSINNNNNNNTKEKAKSCDDCNCSFIIYSCIKKRILSLSLEFLASKK